MTTREAVDAILQDLLVCNTVKKTGTVVENACSKAIENADIREDVERILKEYKNEKTN